MNKALVLSGILFAVAGCSSDSSETNPPVNDAGSDAQLAHDTGTPPLPDSGPDAEIDAGPDASDCTAAKEQLLNPIDSVSTGEVLVLGDEGGVKTIYVDASAGGAAAESTNPRVYVDLGATTRVSVTDKSATTSNDWDLAIKRSVLFTNSGDGGSGNGGAVLVAKDFDSVTTTDATGATFATESFVDPSCNPKVDPAGAVQTAFSGWYDYDESTHVLSPHAGTWLVKGAKGAFYKVAIVTYYATDDGGVGAAGGRFVLKIGAL